MDGQLEGLVDERFAAIKRQHFPSYLDLLKSWQETLKKTEEWITSRQKEFSEFADTVIAQYQGGPKALHDHTYCAKEKQSSFLPHNCSKACWKMGSVIQTPSKYSSLSLPLLVGWKRAFLVRPSSEGGRTDAVYVAPCGRRLRSLDEVQQFLDITCSSGSECNIGITNFTFDPMVSLICPSFNARSSGAKVFIPDITCGKEPIAVTCVNCISSKPPEHFEYITDRISGPEVHIETDPGFLVSCSCTDGCANRSKCECWQLTLQEARTAGRTKHSVGYVHGRLKRSQHSAIYECNSMCQCGPKCRNRLVQKGLQHHLQVFQTEDRGWGLRTLRDIPKGSFICTYVGQIYPEHTLEGQGQPSPTPVSDEYFAELDYIEVMDHHKEGYESDVEFPSDMSSISSGDESDFMDSTEGTTVQSCDVSAPDSPTASEDDQSFTPSSISVISTTISSTQTPTCLSPTSPLPPPPPPPLPSHSPPFLSPTPSPSLPASNSHPKPPSLPSKNTLPHAERRFTSPHNHLIPMSPRKLQGMKTRQYFLEDFSYIIDAKWKGNLGRYINHSCSPNMFVQNVFVDTHDLRFPWVAFFARTRIKALQELTWDYNYEVGSVEGKVIVCYCRAQNCRGRLL